MCKDVNLGGRYFLFQRFITLAGLKITDGALKRFSGEKGFVVRNSYLFFNHHNEHFFFFFFFLFSFRFNPKEPLSLLDLEAMEGRVKHMNIVSAAAGTFFQHKGNNNYFYHFFVLSTIYNFLFFFFFFFFF